MKLLLLLHLFMAVLGLAHICADEIDARELDADQWAGSNQIKVFTNDQKQTKNLFTS